MEPALKDLIHRLSPAGLARFCRHIGIDPIDPRHLGPIQLTRAFEKQLKEVEGYEAWQEAEAAAGEVKRLTAAADVCEQALRDTCFSDIDADRLVRRETVIEDRALDLLIGHPILFRRACNVAMSISLAEQKGHARFDVRPASFDHARLEDAANAIKELLQERHGGHRVIPDLFELRPHAGSGRRWHIALYIERAAQAAIEIVAAGSNLQRRVQRPVYEISLDYSEISGALDVAGKGIGGLPVMQQIADRFSLHALGGEELTPVPKHTWRFERFKRMNPELPAPPAPFGKVRIREICIASPTTGGGRSEHSIGQGSNVYDWLKRSGISESTLRTLQIRSVGLEFETPTADGGETGDTVRMSLRWPNGRNFSNASPAVQDALSAWAVSGAFHIWCHNDA
jgi:hypothetical protein